MSALREPQQPRARLRSERLRLLASSTALASAVLDFQRRNADRFARWDPPLAADFLSLRAQQRRLRRDARAFAEGSGWRWWLQALDGDGDAPPVIGQVHVSQVQRGAFCSAMLGYAIDGAHEGRGLMIEAIGAVIDELFSPAVNLHRVQANARPDNPRSLALLERLGFVREGLAREYLYIDGGWRDHVLAARLNPRFVVPAGW